MNNPLSPISLQQDFPFLKSGVHFLDNASTSQRPQVVIDAITDYYTNYNANVHRGIYSWSEQASEAYEATREAVREFIGASSVEEIIFTSGTTHSLNLAARLLGQDLEKDDEIIVSTIEHHSNLVPWQLVAKDRQAKLVFLDTNEDEKIDPQTLRSLITKKTKILSITHTSNVTGYTLPVRELSDIAHEFNIIVVVDAAQGAPHQPINVQDLGADMLAFSGHKLCGPTGVGVLYGQRDLLNRLEPVYGGGSMIDKVTLERSTWAALPAKHEPGTPNIAGVIGLGTAIKYLQNIGLDAIHARVDELYNELWQGIQSAEGVTSFGPKDRAARTSIVSFTVAGVHAHDVASILDESQVAVRAGHHCAQPLLQKWGVPSTTRASLYFYNTSEDITALLNGIKKAQQLLT
ncbi:MAG: cysteine desulfurase [Candidatus Kerfeldbacteria bacterium CG15_BIG_FIL_POST_REV_8_21_14_020_45_12]|uniref:cysteine desulfurase n=1 Tax=Candidatus Kerfeldbacteria bacterium CG15_BIG_FIL_POST_REV_8_21_14_020_45_12 TaxID=2014247 RepID=A0A2M7H3Z5_9BACT|nr:MAG: cysteine desulfurase [Candidatus Kerfeldbacteria bacterium CG15_BIG_FIL_POST_REV_8_21_14_020_45_12]PJA92763.1 MAG: cysteine desulfurase [Candidatus Kerfeldbacteria bacterium CG_4_9_14_3_um_filter_45_8]